MGTILVKIAQLGKEVKEIALECGTTVEKAIDTLGISTNADAKINGRKVDMDKELTENTILTIIPKVDGGL